MAYGLSYMPDFSRAYSGITDAGKAIGKGLEQRGENKKKSNKLGGTLEAYAPTDEEQVELYGETVDNMGFSQREAAMAKYVAMREQQGRKLFEDFDAAGKDQHQLRSDDAAIGAASQPTSFDSSITEAKMGVKQSDLKLDQAMKERDDARKKVSLWETEKGHINRHKEGAEKGYAGGRKHEIVPGKVSEPITRKLLPLDSGKVDERTKALQGSIGNLQAKIGKLDLDINKEVARGNSLNLDLSKATESQALERDKNMNAARDAASAAPLDIQGALRTAIQANPQAGTNEITGLLKYAQTGMNLEVQGRTKEAQIGAAQDTAKSAAYKAEMDRVTAQFHEGSLTRKALTETMEIAKLAQRGDVPVSILQKLTAGSLEPTDMAGLNQAQLKAVGSMVTLKVNQQNANTQQKLAHLKDIAQQGGGGLTSSQMSFLKETQKQAAGQMEELAKSIQLAKIVAQANPSQTMYDVPAMQAEYDATKKDYDKLNGLTKKVIGDLEKKQSQSGGSSSGGTVFADSAAAKAAGHKPGDKVVINVNGVATLVQLN